MHKFSITLFLLTLSLGLFGQVCGFHPTQTDIDRLLKNKSNFYNSDGIQVRETIYVPIKFHLVADGQGNGRIEEYKVYDELCNLNQAYAPHGIQFYISGGFNNVNNSNIYNTPGSSIGSIQMTAQKAAKGKNHLNIFVAAKADSGSGLGTTLGYYSPTFDLVVIRKDQMGKFNGTVPHEVGHFFSLMHTFNGWDSEAYDKNKHGNPIASKFSPGGVLNELQDGSNCEDAGDFLCDTKPDYNFGFGWDGCNPFTDEIKDFNGDIIEVDEENFMGYFIGCSEYHFSDMQIAMVKEDYMSSKRDYIKSNFVPTGQQVEGEINIESPENNEDLGVYTEIKLDWNDVPNASRYYVYMKQGASNKARYTTTESAIVLPDLLKNKQYRWYVAAVSDFPGCSVRSEEYKFKTGELVYTNVTELASLEVYPTVLNSNQVTIQSSEDMIIDYQLIDITGRTVDSGQQRIYNGNNQLSFESNDLGGIYFLNLNSEKGSKQVKLMFL